MDNPTLVEVIRSDRQRGWFVCPDCAAVLCDGPRRHPSSP